MVQAMLGYVVVEGCNRRYSPVNCAARCTFASRGKRFSRSLRACLLSSHGRRLRASCLASGALALALASASVGNIDEVLIFCDEAFQTEVQVARLEVLMEVEG